MKFVMCVSTRTSRCAADCQSALAQSVCRCVVVWAGRYLNGKVADIDRQSVISYAVDVLGRSSRSRVYTAKSVDGLALSNHCCTLVCTRRTAGCVGRWSVERGAGRQHICLAPAGDVAVTSRVHVNSCTAEAEPVSLSLYDSGLYSCTASVLVCSLAVLDPRVGHTMDVLSPFVSVLCDSY